MFCPLFSLNGTHQRRQQGSKGSPPTMTGFSLISCARLSARCARLSCMFSFVSTHLIPCTCAAMQCMKFFTKHGSNALDILCGCDCSDKFSLCGAESGHGSCFGLMQCGNPTVRQCASCGVDLLSVGLFPHAASTKHTSFPSVVSVGCSGNSCEDFGISGMGSLGRSGDCLIL